MSPKPVDPLRSLNVGRALETLRGERPRPEAADALLNALHRPARRRSVARPLAFAMMTTALALALVFPPRTKAGAAWAQTLANTFDSPAVHSVSHTTNGAKGMEEWRSGRKRAHVLYFRDGKPGMEWRDDGKRLYNYAAMFTDSSSPNSRRWGMVSKSPGVGLLYEMPYGSPERLLKSPGVEVLAHDEASGDKPETYRLRIPGPLPRLPKRTALAELDSMGRIHRISTPGEEGATTIDYPDRIPEVVFEPRPHAITGVGVYDILAQTKTIQNTLRKGLGKRGPVTLRLVTLDGYGTLWAFWTGALPDAKMSRPIRIPGIKGKEYATKKAFTSDWKPTPYGHLGPNVTGTRIGGMSFVPRQKLGSMVDLDVPYPGGVARFRNVPVLRVSLLNHYEQLLGIYVDYPGLKKK